MNQTASLAPCACLPIWHLLLCSSVYAAPNSSLLPSKRQCRAGSTNYTSVCWSPYMCALKQNHCDMPLLPLQSISAAVHSPLQEDLSDEGTTHSLPGCVCLLPRCIHCFTAQGVTVNCRHSRQWHHCLFAVPNACVMLCCTGTASLYQWPCRRRLWGRTCPTH